LSNIIRTQLGATTLELREKNYRGTGVGVWNERADLTGLAACEAHTVRQGDATMEVVVRTEDARVDVQIRGEHLNRSDTVAPCPNGTPSSYTGVSDGTSGGIGCFFQDVDLDRGGVYEFKVDGAVAADYHIEACTLTLPPR
jgi:hypothetical protein